MIGKRQIVLDASEWLKGMSTGTEVADGGFSDLTEGVNLTNVPGVVYAPAASVDGDSDSILDSTGEIIATCPDHNVSSGREFLAVTDTGFYVTYNGTKLVTTSHTDATNTYGTFFTHMAPFQGATFITAKENIIKWTSATTFDDEYADFTNQTMPHPLIVFENNLYYGDGNLLLRQIGISGVPATILTLSADQVIVALGIDPGSGKLLISTTSGLNASGTLPKTNKLHWYNGSSNKTSKTVIVGDIITSFESVASTVYVGYGTSLGFINGSGVQWLRNLKNVTFATEILPYQNKITSIGNAG